MADFWTYESKTTQQARDAESWAAKAKQDAAEWLGQQHAMSDGTPEEGVRPLSPGSVLAPDKGWDWTNNDTNSIQRGPDTKPKQSGGHSLLGSIGGFLDDAASTVFMGDVRQPWDLLRPVQRALEAEQKYVARPIAKAALSPLGDYDSLPGIVRAGAETIFDPLTYIGPGAVTDAFKAARLAGGVKLAAPALETLFTGPGSRRVLAHVAEQAGYGLAAVGGGTLFEELGLPGMVGSVAGPAGIQALMGHVPGRTPTGGRDYMGIDAESAAKSGTFNKTQMGYGEQQMSRETLQSRFEQVQDDLDRVGQEIKDGNSGLHEAYSSYKREYDAYEAELQRRMSSRPDVQKALAGEDRDLAEYFKQPEQAKAKIDSEMSATIALGATPRGREIMAKKTKGEPLNGKDLEDMANLLNDARYPDCAES